jgi:predicted transcriptional regulator
MDVLWREGDASVRDVLRSFGDRVAYTTIMTTLDRLHRKGLLDRRKMRRAFIYSPRFSFEEFKRTVATDVIDGLLGTDAEPILACIVDAVSDRDQRLLDHLDKLVERKKREIAGKQEV